MLMTVRAIPICCWCGRKTRIRANGTATAHKVRGAGCRGSGRAVNLIASCGCGELAGVFAYPPGRPYRKALVSATVCNRADHQDAMRRWTAEMAGTPEIGFAPELAPSSSAS
jgi:hypothetical protein